MQRWKSLLMQRPMRAILALPTMLVLAPVPLLAFTWIGNWQQVALYSTSNVTTAPTWSATDTASGGTVHVDMGSASGTGITAGASVVLSRRLQTNGGLQEMIQVQSAYQVLLQNANIHFRIWFVPVVPRVGELQPTITFARAPIGNRPKTEVNTLNRKVVLPTGTPANQGNFIVYISVTAITKGSFGGANKTNQWSNPDPKTASSHTFTFTG